METTMADIFDKIKMIVKGPQGELFAKIVDSFYEQVGDEYFSREDLADIQSGLDEIEQGEHLAWDDCKSKHGL